jgi:tetratricopeptide (TPR) repeat protein
MANGTDRPAPQEEHRESKGTVPREQPDPSLDLRTREQRLDEVIAAYLQAVEAGQAPSREELLARHLDLATELAAFFADQDRFARLAPPLRALVTTVRPERAAAEPPAAGARIGYFGDYELLGEIARGGMGIVYRARQRSLRRVVALKMIRAVHTTSPADLRRFHTEAEMIAALDHPHIVPIHEIGEFQEQHYFTMKLIDGGNLTQRLDDVGLPHLDRTTGKDPQGRRWRADEIAERQVQIARLMIPVVQAVHYAHQRGLLHRDLKPANILLDTQGRPHITDFGLAKHVQDDPGLTQSGAIVGTPSYMAPEQACGRREALTTAADVYSLGAILYELLTGRPPFRAETPLATLRQASEREPIRPGSLNPCVNTDLETICLKCLEKEPGRRYASAQALAEDLQRFVDQEPIHARRRGLARRLGRWPGRHRRALVLAAAVGLLLGFLMILHLLRVIERQRRAEIAAILDVEEMRRFDAEQLRHEEKARADANFQRARQAVDEMLAALAENTLAQTPQAQAARQKLLENAATFYRTLAREKANDPALLQRIGQAQLQLGELQRQLGRTEDAQASLQAALALFQILVQESPQNPAYRADLARTQECLGNVLLDSGRAPEAEAKYRQALALWEKLATASPRTPAYRVGQAAAYQDLSRLLQAAGRLPEAEAMLRKAMALQQGMLRDKAAPAQQQEKSKPRK